MFTYIQKAFGCDSAVTRELFSDHSQRGSVSVLCSNNDVLTIYWHEASPHTPLSVSVFKIIAERKRGVISVKTNQCTTAIGITWEKL